MQRHDAVRRGPGHLRDGDGVDRGHHVARVQNPNPENLKYKKILYQYVMALLQVLQGLNLFR